MGSHFGLFLSFFKSEVFTWILLFFSNFPYCFYHLILWNWLCSSGDGAGSLGVPPQRGDNYECRNMKLLLKQQQRVMVLVYLFNFYEKIKNKIPLFCLLYKRHCNWHPKIMRVNKITYLCVDKGCLPCIYV